MNDIAIHTVVKNEPFVYYAVKSVYDDADEIHLYDTGSNDRHTLNDIDRLLSEDVDKKISFKSVPIEIDQNVWSYEKINECKEIWKDKFGVTDVRQMQIDATTARFFLVVDGDEVHHRDTIRKIKEALPKFQGGVVWAKIPYYSFCDVDKIHGYKRGACRLFMTDKIYMEGTFPDDAMFIKGVGRMADRPDQCMHIYNVTSYAHFEMCIKPWRRPHVHPVVQAKSRYIPEVIRNNPYYIERFKREREADEYKRYSRE